MCNAIHFGAISYSVNMLLCGWLMGEGGFENFPRLKQNNKHQTANVKKGWYGTAKTSVTPPPPPPHDHNDILRGYDKQYEITIFMALLFHMCIFLWIVYTQYQPVFAFLSDYACHFEKIQSLKADCCYVWEWCISILHNSHTKRTRERLDFAEYVLYRRR